MATRAKMQCHAVEPYGQSTKVTLFCVYEGALGDNEENRRFFLASPNGRLEMTIDNPGAAVQFKQGRYYYLDMSEAPVDADASDL